MNDGQTRTYDPKLIIITFGGVPITGYSGTFVTIEKGDNFKEDEGADGTENRSNISKSGALCTLVLLQQSLTNDQLDAIAETDALSNNGKKPFTLKDLNGTTFVFCRNAYIMGKAKIQRGNEASPVEWKIRLPNVQMKNGGNIL